MPHVVLFLLVTREHANLTHIGLQEAVENGIAEAPGPAGNEHRLAGKMGEV
jgi:hypothetical protein